jgi:hypothetical protein
MLLGELAIYTLFQLRVLMEVDLPPKPVTSQPSFCLV